MTDYKLTIESLTVTGQTVSVIAHMGVFPSGDVMPSHEERRNFVFPVAAADAAIANEIDKWFNAQVDIHASRIAKADEANRLAALKATLEKTETV